VESNLKIRKSVMLMHDVMLIAVLLLFPVSLRAATSSTAPDTEHSYEPSPLCDNVKSGFGN
jgi:hypothetical protein